MVVVFFNREVDSDGDEVPDEEGEESAESLDGYRVWYAVEVFVDPPPPERTLQITCACQVSASTRSIFWDVTHSILGMPTDTWRT